MLIIVDVVFIDTIVGKMRRHVLRQIPNYYFFAFSSRELSVLFFTPFPTMIDTACIVMGQRYSSGRYLAASTGSWFRWDRLLLQLNRLDHKLILMLPVILLKQNQDWTHLKFNSHFTLFVPKIKGQWHQRRQVEKVVYWGNYLTDKSIQ